jgi:hypothetical protein
MESLQVQAEGIADSISSAAVVFPLPVEIQGQLYLQVQLHPARGRPNIAVTEGKLKPGYWSEHKNERF